MVANMKVDKMDGFCVGEPWNNRAIVDGIGYTVTTTQKMWKDHPEKVCAFTEEFATKNPEDGEGGAEGAAPGERAPRQAGEPAKAAAEVVSRPTYINCPPEIILERLLGKYNYGDGRKEQDPNYMIFSDRDSATTRSQIFGKWWLTPVPPLGHGQGHARLQGHRRRECCARTSISRR